jgi:phospholipid/cholesterol/gamma-HCH transport system substrate-binding protein
MPPASARALRFRLGAFVLIALLLLGALVLMFGGAPTLFRRTTDYTIRFTDAPGVAPGTPVRRSGVRIGEVREVRLDDETGVVRVVIGIEPGHTVRRNEVPTLVTTLLGGDATIDFIPKEPPPGQVADRAPWPPGSEIPGERPVNVNALLRGASEVVPTTQETLNDIRNTMKSFEKLQPEAERALVQYRLLGQELRAALPELRKTNAEAQKLSPAAEEALKEIRDLARDIRNSMPEFRKTNAEVQRFAKEAADAAPELRKTNAEIQALAKDVRAEIPGVRRNLDDIGDAARQARRTTERVDLLLQKNEQNITRSIENLDQALRRANDVLNDENRKNLAETLKNVRKGTDRLDAIAGSLDDVLNQGRTTVRQLNSTLKEAEELMRDLRGTTGPLRERGPSILRNLDESLIRSNAALADLQALVRAVGDSDGTLTRLLKDPSLYNNLDCAAAQFAREMQRVDRILKDVETFADKIARHPEALGVGGAVRPGSGLKDKDPPPQYPPPTVVPPH